MNSVPTKLPTLEKILDFSSRFDFEQIAIQTLAYLIYIVAAWIFLAVIFRFIIVLLQLKEKKIILEITPPRDTKITAISTAELFNLINELISHKSFKDRLLLKQNICSLEIVSSRNNGIQFFALLPKSLVGSLTKNLRAYMPGVLIKEVDEYLPKEINNFKISEYKLAKHFSFSIKEQDDLKKHDPLAYLTANMTELKDNEMMAIQVILKPLNGIEETGKRRAIKRINNLIKLGRADSLQSASLELFAGTLESIARIAILPLLAIADFITGHESKLPERSRVFKTSSVSKDFENSIKSKITEPLVGVSIRTLIIANEAKEKENGMLASFSSYRHNLGQGIVRVKNIIVLIFQPFALWLFKNRIANSKVVFSPGEIASLYHFPYETNPEHSDLVRNKSRELPAPLSLKQTDSSHDVIFGVNKFGTDSTPIGLSLEQRQKHMYIIGKTGMGKTTLLKNAIYQDMLNGKGLAVLDPHGDLLQELLEIIPENRKEDVIVFDPSDREWPIGLNILQPGIKFANKDDEDEWITSSVLAVFAKITAKEYWGPRMEHILRNATLTALQMENPNLWTLQRLLTDKGFQKKTAMTLKDPVLRQFWNKEFALLGKMQLSNVIAPLTQRLGSFITTKMSRHILLQEKSTISISQIMNEGKILLVNLSKGDLGEDMSFFFGMVITSLIWMAAYQRTKIPEKDRKDFFLYVDEFQNFATPRFAEITSEGRKYHVSLIASHQNLAQVEDKDILKVVAGNANTIICLKASPDDEKFILPFMEPEVEKGDIVNLPPYRFFMKLTNEKSENAFSGITVPLNILPNDEVKKSVIDYSRNSYARPRAEIEKYLEQIFSGKISEQKTKKPVKNTAKKTEKESQLSITELP